MHKIELPERLGFPPELEVDGLIGIADHMFMSDFCVGTDI
jgi:hypothetical protein